MSVPSLYSIPPIAHRGLHAVQRGIIENTVSAFEGAIARGFAIETDIQPAQNDEPVIFHDERLERLTEGSGLIREHDAAALATIPMQGTRDRIITLAELLELTAGRVPLYLEIKSRDGRNFQLERHIADLLEGYAGVASVMSFDPRSMIVMRNFAPHVPRGLLAMRYGRLTEPRLPGILQFRLTHMLDIGQVKPDFLTYEIHDLAVMHGPLRRRYPDLPILGWTVQSAEERRKAALYADGMIFEGFMPNEAEGG